MIPSGKGDDRKVAVSETAERIIRNAPDRQALVRQVALAPKIHSEVWTHYSSTGLPHDDIITRYLKWERPKGSQFTDDAVGGFITRLRATFAYAGIGTADKMVDADGDDESDGDEEKPKVGDFVQWTSQGVEQFPTPQPLKGISPDGAFGFVEITNTGIPMDQLTVAEAPKGEAKTPAAAIGAPPVNPYFQPPKQPGPFLSFNMGPDNVFEMRLTKMIPWKDFDRLKQMINLYEDSIVDPATVPDPKPEPKPAKSGGRGFDL